MANQGNNGQIKFGISSALYHSGDNICLPVCYPKTQRIHNFSCPCISIQNFILQAKGRKQIEELKNGLPREYLDTRQGESLNTGKKCIIIGFVTCTH
jgi:hypothetical protein